MTTDEMVKAIVEAEAARQAEKERDERSRSHVRVDVVMGGRRINDHKGSPGRTLCGGEFTSYDMTLPEARRMAKKGELEKWVGCATCREKVAPSMDNRSVNFGMKLAREVFSKRGNHSEAHLPEAELAALLALAFEAGRKAGSR